MPEGRAGRSTKQSKHAEYLKDKGVTRHVDPDRNAGPRQNQGNGSAAARRLANGSSQRGKPQAKPTRGSRRRFGL